MSQPQTYLVPIDACYEFVGHLRMVWRGFDGGQQAREFIDAFFDGQRRIPVRGLLRHHVSFHGLESARTGGTSR